MKHYVMIAALLACSAPAYAVEQKPYVLSAQQKMIEIPVLARNVEKGAMIQEQDVEWVELAEHKLRRGTLTESEDIVGKLAKRWIKAGEQVAQNAVARPRIIEKGGLIAMIYRTETMQIKDMGVALENGSAGDIIRVKNEKSGKTVLVKVQKNGEAIVNFEG